MTYVMIFQITLAFLVLLFIYKFIIVALLKLNFYKKQGLQTEFFPVLGSFVMNLLKSDKKHKDSFYDLKLLATKNPQLRALVQNFGTTPVVLLLDPSLKKELAFSHDNYDISDLLGDFAKIINRGLSGTKGEEWKKQRRIIAQAFHFELLKENVSLIVSTATSLLDEIAKKDLSKILIRKEMETITGEIIGRVFFSESLQNYSINGKSVSNHMMGTIEDMGKALLSPGYMMFGSKYIEKGFFKSHRNLMNNFKLIETTCNQILEDRRNLDIQTKDLAWHLLETQKNPREEDQISNEVIVANYATFIMAGTITTSLLISGVLFALAHNPDMLERLKDEIKEIYDKESSPSLDTLNKMNWLSALLKETLRVFNPVGLGTGMKNASRDHQIGDINIKKGSMVIASFIHKAFDSQYFEDPFNFNPQRWLDKPNVSEPYAYTPFWAGQRNCIGQHLALIEAKFILCEFIKRFDFEVLEDKRPQEDIIKGFDPNKNLPMKLSMRNQ